VVEVPMEPHYQLIKQAYENRAGGDSVQLLLTVLSVAERVGVDNALACLEGCVVEKRLAWLDANLESLERTGDPVLDGYRLFFEVYLGLSIPEDGEIVERSASKLVMRWWNPCPTLEACMELGLDTRQVCRGAYHRPVQAFLSRLHPGLRFDRNYQALRPHTPYCEEIITLDDV
jgi:tRNA(adenine34) deaminase